MFNTSDFDEEINIKSIIHFITRNKNNIIKIFLLILFPSLIVITLIKSTYKGNIKVEITRSLIENNNQKFRLKKREVATKLGDNTINIQLDETQKQRYSEFLIEKKYLLLSAETFDSIYQEVDFKKNINANYNFDGWFKSNLEVQTIDNILSINVFGKDKEKILLTLNLINEKYKELDIQNDDFHLFVTTSPLITNDTTPNKLALYFFSLIPALVISLTIVFIKEKFSGIVYELSECKKFINLEFLETIFINNLDLTKKLLIRSLEENQIQSNIGVIFYKFRKEEKKNLINQMFLSLKKEIKVIDIQDEELIGELKKIIIFIPNGELTYGELETLNFYIKVYQEKISGWFFVE